ncbi:MAG: hypothetical protein WBD06_06440 [Acidobacteriaceae bacterium]
MSRFLLVFLLLPLAVTPFALADVSVGSPGNGSQVSSPFQLSASATTCSNKPVVAMGYSLDSSTDNTIVDETSVSAQVPASLGSHTIHVKAWNSQGGVCVTDVAVTVVASTPTNPVAASTTSAGITVSSPVNGATVASPFALTASASSCQSQAISAMGYSLDSSADTTIVDSTTIGATVSASAGAHTLHVKSWGSGGGACAASVAITVSTSSTAAVSSAAEGITVSSPGSGASVSSPFSLSASAPTCSSQPVTAMGYSLDNSSDTTIISGTSMNTQVTAASGAHTLHVKSWGNGGAGCADALSITVSGGSTATSSGPTVPSSALSVSSLQTLSDWTATHDTAATGSASGSTSIVTSPTLSGNARKFVTTFSDNGNERYSASFSDDTTSTNFVYDGWVYIPSGTGTIANIEMDMNQTMSNGETVIFGFQCDGWHGTWDYTINAGSASSPVDKWAYTSQACNPANWSRDTWHHVQVSYSHTSGGTVSYSTVWLDGVQQTLNVSGFSGFSLGWGPSLVTNFQVDGKGSGTATVYLDKLTVSRW